MKKKTGNRVQIQQVTKISVLGYKGQKPKPSQELTWEWFVIPSKGHLGGSEQEMDQAGLRIHYSGFLTIWSTDSFTLEKKNKRILQALHLFLNK